MPKPKTSPHFHRCLPRLLTRSCPNRSLIKAVHVSKPQNLPVQQASLFLPRSTTLTPLLLSNVRCFSLNLKWTFQFLSPTTKLFMPPYPTRYFREVKIWNISYFCSLLTFPLNLPAYNMLYKIFNCHF